VGRAGSKAEKANCEKEASKISNKETSNVARVKISEDLKITPANTPGTPHVS